jgi:hypothetical protein
MLTTGGIWQQLICNKFLGSKPLSQAFWKSGDSHLWVGFIKVKNDFLRFGTFSIKNSVQIRFWGDQWLGISPLREQYMCLYHIVQHKQTTVAEVFSSSPVNFSWHRYLIGPKLVAWNEMLPRLANITLTQEPDEFRWNLLNSVQFSMKSHYMPLIYSDVPNLNKRPWNLKVPLKIKIY